MLRIKLHLPQRFSFSTLLPVRITDVNYGGHVGNDAILSLIHEARVQFLQHYSYTEMNVEGIGLMMSNAAIEFKKEAFYGDQITAFVAASDFSRAGFDIYYKLLKEDSSVVVATAKTGMICYDYNLKKVVSVPEKARQALERL